MSIRLILLGVILLLGGLGAITAATSWVSNTQADRALESVVANRVVPLRELKRLSEAYAVDVVDAAHKLRNGPFDWETGERTVQAALIDIGTVWPRLAEAASDPRVQALYEVASARRSVADQAVSDLLGIIQRRDRSQLDDFVRDAMYPAIDPLTAAFSDLTDVQVDLAQEGYRYAAGFTNTINWLLVFLSSSGMAGFLFAVWIVITRVTRPVTGMTEAMRRLADDDVSVRIPSRIGVAEMDAMAQTVEVFKRNAIERRKLQQEETERHARQETERRKLLSDMAADLEQAVGRIIGDVSQASADLAATAQQVTKSAQSTTMQAETVVIASTDTNHNIQTVASATEQLNAAIRDVTQRVSEAARTAKDAASAAGTASQLIDGLTAASRRINDVTGLIGEIAEQTNLLALNATIEAARAGEAGKGFSVVANAVKSLASETGRATIEIQHEIEAMSAVINDVVATIRDIVKRIDDIDGQNAAIASAVEQQAATTGEIARNMSQAAEGVGMVEVSIRSLSGDATETGSAILRVNAAAESLAREAGLMRDTLDGFLERLRSA